MDRRASKVRTLSLFLCTLAALPGCGAAGDQDPSAVASAPAEWSDLLPNPRQPLAGVLSGGQPSAEQLQAASAAGFKTVINLRVPGERGTRGEPERVAALGMTYVSIPVEGADGLTEDNARRLDDALREAERPILLHCGSGNRIGALFALMAFHLEGKSAEEALEIGREAGLTGYEPAVRHGLREQQ